MALLLKNPFLSGNDFLLDIPRLRTYPRRGITRRGYGLKVGFDALEKEMQLGISVSQCVRTANLSAVSSSVSRAFRQFSQRAGIAAISYIAPAREPAIAPTVSAS